MKQLLEMRKLNGLIAAAAATARTARVLIIHGNHRERKVFIIAVIH
jgi:hypothetical protein